MCTLTKHNESRSKSGLFCRCMRWAEPGNSGSGLMCTVYERLSLRDVLAEDCCDVGGNSRQILYLNWWRCWKLVGFFWFAFLLPPAEVWMVGDQPFRCSTEKWVGQIHPVLVEYLLWSNKAENKDTEVLSYSTLSSLMHSTCTSVFNFVRERGDPFCQPGAGEKGWCDPDQTRGTHGSNSCAQQGQSSGTKRHLWLNTQPNSLGFSSTKVENCFHQVSTQTSWSKKLSTALLHLLPAAHPRNVCDVSGMEKKVISSVHPRRSNPIPAAISIYCHK